MDLNEYAKGLISQYTPQVQQGLGLVAGAAQHGLGLMAQDAGTVASYMNDPRNAWIGMNPVGRIGMEGLGLIGALGARYGGFGTNSIQDLLSQAFARERDARMQGFINQRGDKYSSRYRPANMSIADKQEYRAFVGGADESMLNQTLSNVFSAISKSPDEPIVGLLAHAHVSPYVKNKTAMTAKEAAASFDMADAMFPNKMERLMTPEKLAETRAWAKETLRGGED